MRVRRTLALAVGCGLVASAAGGVLIVRRSAQLALQAEARLHAGILVTEVLAGFVRDQRRWPTSWDELRGARRVDHGFLTWPDSLDDVRRHLDVRFDRGIPSIDPPSPWKDYIVPTGPMYTLHLEFGWGEVLDAIGEIEGPAAEALSPARGGEAKTIGNP